MNGGYRGYGAMSVGTPSSGMSMQQAGGAPIQAQGTGTGAPSLYAPQGTLGVPGLAAPGLSIPGGVAAPGLSIPGLTASTLGPSATLAPGTMSSASLLTPQSAAQSYLATPQGAQQASLLQSVLNPMTRSTRGLGMAQPGGMFPSIAGGGPLPEDMADAAALDTILDQISDSVAGNLKTSFSYAVDDLVEEDDHGHVIDHDDEEWDEHDHLVYHDVDEDILTDYELPHPSLRGTPLHDLAARIERSRENKKSYRRKGKSKFGGQKKPCGCPQYGALNAPSQGGYFGDSMKIGAGLALGVFAVAAGAMILSKAIK